MKGGVVLLLGEAFRTGGQGSRTRGLPGSVQDQLTASESHVAFVRHLESAHPGLKCRLLLHTYTTPYDADLLGCYGGDCAAARFLPEALGYEGLLENAVSENLAELQLQDFVLVLRVDLVLKPLFMRLFDPSADRLLYSSICMLPYHVLHDNIPRAADMVLFVPRRHLEGFLHGRPPGCGFLTHHGFESCRARGLRWPEDVGVYLPTFHDSDSEKDWNPLYRIANRPESRCWQSRGRIIDVQALRPELAAAGYDDDDDPERHRRCPPS